MIINACRAYQNNQAFNLKHDKYCNGEKKYIYFGQHNSIAPGKVFNLATPFWMRIVNGLFEKTTISERQCGNKDLNFVLFP